MIGGVIPDRQPWRRAEGVREGRSRGDHHERSGRARGGRQDRAARRRRVWRRDGRADRRRLVEPIEQAIDSGKPFPASAWACNLVRRGLRRGPLRRAGDLRGEVVRFDLPAEYKVPHMGWNPRTSAAARPSSPAWKPEACLLRPLLLRRAARRRCDRDRNRLRRSLLLHDLARQHLATSSIPKKAATACGF